MLLDGSLRAQGRADESRTLTPPTLVGFEWALERAHPGDAVGLYETLAGTARGAVGRDPFRLVVEETGAALRIDREELFDLIGQRPALLQQLFAALIGVRHPSSGG